VKNTDRPTVVSRLDPWPRSRPAARLAGSANLGITSLIAARFPLRSDNFVYNLRTSKHIHCANLFPIVQNEASRSSIAMLLCQCNRFA